MGPYREPQPLPPPPRDPMRVVLFAAGGLAACIVVAAVAMLVEDKRATTHAQGGALVALHDDAAAKPLVATPGDSHGPVLGWQIDRSEQPEQEETWGWVHIDRGIAVSAMETYCTPGTPPRTTDVSLAVFRADDATSPAIRLFTTSHGTYELPLHAGRYEICSGGYSVDPRCGHLGEPPINRTSCPPGDKLCTCTPPDASRKTWSAFCKKVNVGNGVVRIHVGSGLGIGYSCTPQEACP